MSCEPLLMRGAPRVMGWTFFLVCLLSFTAGCQLPVEAGGGGKNEDPLHSWVGEWEGEMVNLRGEQASAPIPVELRIHPLEDGTYEWRTLYAKDLERGLKDYRVLPDASDPTRFTMDEQNGILLDLRLLDGVLLAPFEVNGMAFLSRYFLEPDGTLRHEVIVWGGESTETAADMPVISHTVTNVQRTILRRVQQ